MYSIILEGDGGARNIEEEGGMWHEERCETLVYYILTTYWNCIMNCANKIQAQF